MTTHPSILAWRIPWTEEPGGLQSMGSLRPTGIARVRHNLATKQQHIIERQLGTHESMGNGSIFVYMHAKLLQSCLTLGDLMDCSLPGFSVFGILQARILEQVAMPFSGWSFRHTDGTGISFVC